MSNSSVTVLTPHGRRQNVQVNPHMTLLQILEEVCKKYNEFKSEEYCLKHHNKELDLSQMFRFSGLPNKCLLEMEECNKKREESEVLICIQLENGTRHQGQFLPNQTLIDVLQELAPNSVIENPIVVYMRRDIYGDDLQKTTLKSLGITKGRAMFRILNKNPDELKSQANVYVPPTKVESKTEETEGKEISKNKFLNKSDKKGLEISKEVIKNTIIKDNTQKVEKCEVEPMEVDKTEHETKKNDFDWGTATGRSMNKISDNLQTENNNLEEDDDVIEEPEIFEIGERNAVVFSLESAQKNVENLPDSFFDLTVDDLKILLRDLHKQSSGNEDAPLLTAKLRELEENNRTLKKLGQYKKVVIRIQFPNRMVLQGTFNPVEKLEVVYDFVKTYLKNPNLNFILFTIPPKKILEKEITLVEANLIPTAVLHFAVNESNTEEKDFLKENLKQTSATGAILAASKSRGLITKQKNDVENENDEAGPSERKTPSPLTGAIPKNKNSFKKSSKNTDSIERVPKWFKPSKK